MPNNDSHQHVVKTSAQWNERAIEYWIVPRGCLCVELTGKGKTKIKVGEGDKNYYQLPYITDYTDLSNYYTKEEVNNLINNLEFMSIKSTEEYDSKSDLPLVGNELGDVRFVKSASPSIKIDPDVYLWNGTKWIFVGTPVSDMTQFVTKAEFNVVKDKVDEIYPKAHTHSNKEILDGITQADRDKFDDLHNYDDTEIRELIHETGHVHWNKPVLDQINQADLDKLDSLHNYDDTDVKNRLTVVEEKAHQHTNKAVLDSLTESKIQGYDAVVEYSFVVRQNLDVLNEEVEDLKGKIHYHDNIDILNYTTASYTLEQQQLLYELDAIDVFVGAGPTWNGIMGYVPAPEAGCQNYFLRGDGTWALVKATGDKYKAGEGIYILSGETTADSFPFKLYAKGGYVKQYVIYGAPGGVGEWNATTQTYHIPIRVSAEGHTSIDTVIQVRDKLYENDWINFETQEYSVYRTNLTSQFQNLIAINEMSGIDTAGNFNKPPGYWPQFALSDYYEIDPDAKYEIPEHGDHWSYEYANVNMYDANKNRTRTILRSKTSKVQIVPLAGEKYLRIAWWVDINFSTNLHTFRDPVMYQLKDTVSPVPSPLQQIQLIPNTINTIDVLTTVKPLDMYVETVVPPDPDPDDPMSEYTGIIYNDGVIDITQEDPTNLAELTVHFRDDVTKTLTIPSSGDEYIAGNHINFSRVDPDGLPAEYTRVEYIESAENATVYLDTGYDGNTGFTAVLDLQYYPSSHRQLMGMEPGTGNYFGSNADEHFEMGSGVHATSDTTQRNTVKWHHTLTSSAKLEWNGSYVTDQNGYGGYNGNFKLFSPFSDYKSQLKIYSCIMYDNNDQVVRNFVPCKTALGVPGFYDTVTEQFYSGQPVSLLAGPVVSPSGPTAINADEMVGADGTNDGEAGVVPAPLAGDENKFLRGDGTWVEVKSGGDKYKAGEGIVILSGEVISDTFPFEIFPKAATVTQYVIYGTASGVGNLVSGHYEVPIKVSAPGHTDIIQTISLSDPLYDGDYIDFQRQVFVHYRTEVTSQITTDPAYSYKKAIYSDGVIRELDPGAYGDIPRVSRVYELMSGATYELTPWNVNGYSDFNRFRVGQYLNIYDADMNITRTLYQEHLGNTIIIVGENEKYMRMTVRQWGNGNVLTYQHLYRLYPMETPCALQALTLYPGVVNTVDVLTTNKPNEIYVEVVPPDDEDIDPDDPMSEYTGIIYNDGVLDVTQEDPNNLNELTFHYRDDVDKTLTIPSASVMEYVEGQGIEFETDSETYLFAENLYMLSNTPIDTGIIPSGSYDFHIEMQFKRVGTAGFSIICYNGYAGSFSYQPGYGRSWIYNGHESWIDLYGTAAPSNSICTVDLKWGRNMTMQIFPNGTYYSKTTSYDPTNVCHVLLNSSGGNESYVYYVKMWDGDTLVGDLVPCVRQSDNATGFFNKVDNTFHTNTSGPAIAHGTLTGESYEMISPTSINAKLGDGLSFDSNDAITVDEMTGADGTNDGTSGTVPAPTATDNTKFLRGDGTWAEINDTNYAAGEGINISAAASSEYTEVEYIKSTGTQYILTDIAPDYTMRIVLDVKFGSTVLSSVKSVKKIFGYYNGGSTNTAFLAIWLDDDADHGNLDYICFYDGFRWVQGGPRTNELDDVDVTTRSTVVIQRGTCSWGSATCTTLDSAVTEPNPTTGMPIFAGFESNKYDIFGRRDMYLYSFKIYNNDGELINHLIPVKRNADDEPGLYDLKTYKFYTNMGTGVFTLGSDIGPAPSDEQVISAKLGNGLHFDANGAIEADSVAYTASHGIEIVSDDIEASLGSGLTLDANDAITLDEATKFILNCNNDLT